MEETDPRSNGSQRNKIRRSMRRPQDPVSLTGRERNEPPSTLLNAVESLVVEYEEKRT
jgi:hypothetical protein